MRRISPIGLALQVARGRGSAVRFSGFRFLRRDEHGP